MTEEVVKDLEKAIKTDYHEYFAQDGFFWGGNSKNTLLKNKKQDEEFLDFCKWALKNKQVVEYEVAGKKLPIKNCGKKKQENYLRVKR